MKAYVCDKCGIVVTETEIMKCMTKLTYRTDYVGCYLEKYVCNNCLKRLNEWFNEKEVE